MRLWVSRSMRTNENPFRAQPPLQAKQSFSYRHASVSTGHCTESKVGFPVCSLARSLFFQRNESRPQWPDRAHLKLRNVKKYVPYKFLKYKKG